MIVEPLPATSRRKPEPHRPGLYRASTLLCTPASLLPGSRTRALVRRRTEAPVER